MTLKDIVIKGMAVAQQALLVKVCEGSRVSMHSCTIQGAEAVGVEGNGSVLTATKSIMRSRSGSGLRVCGGGRAVVVDGCECASTYKKLDKVGLHGISVEGRESSLTARGSKMHSEAALSSGLEVSLGGKAVLDGCVCSHNNARGIVVRDSGSSLIASRCSACCNFQTALDVSKGASAVLTGCNFDGGGSGVMAYENAQLRATDCSASGTACDGVTVSHGARAELRGCVIEANQDSGLAVSDGGTTVSATECRVNSNGRNNVSVFDGAHLKLHACEANHSKGFNGILALGEGTELVCGGGTSAQGNHKHDLLVVDGASANTSADCNLGKAVGV